MRCLDNLGLTFSELCASDGRSLGRSHSVFVCKSSRMISRDHFICPVASFSEIREIA